MNFSVAWNSLWNPFKKCLTRTFRLINYGLFYLVQHANTFAHQLGEGESVALQSVNASTWKPDGTCSRELIPSVKLCKGKNKCELLVDPKLDECIRIYGSLDKEFEGTLNITFEESSGNYNVHQWECQNSMDCGDDVKLFLRAIELRLLAIQLNTILPYPKDWDSSKPVSLVESEEQITARASDMLDVLELIYEYSFNKVEKKSYVGYKVQFTDEDLNNVSKIIVDIFNFIFCINPSVMKYVNEILKYRSHPSENKEMHEKFRNFEEKLLRTKPSFQRLGKDVQTHLGLAKFFELDNMYLFTGDKAYNDLWDKYTKLNEELVKLLDSIADIEFGRFEEDFNCFNEKVMAFSHQFENVSNEKRHLLNTPKTNTVSGEEINHKQFKLNIQVLECIGSGLNNLLEFISAWTKISEYKYYCDNFRDLRKILMDKFWVSIQTSIELITAYKEDVIWNAGYLNFDLYIWETARLIETDPEASPSIVNYLKEQLSSGNMPYYDRFINNYNSGFIGLLKSVCDISPEGLKSNINSLEIEEKVKRLLSQDCGIQDLITFYLSFKQAEEPKTEILNFDESKFESEVARSVLMIYKRFKEENIKTFKDIHEKKNKKINVYLYLLQILGFKKLYAANGEYKSELFYLAFNNGDLSAKFRRSKYFESSFANSMCLLQYPLKRMFVERT